PALLCGQTVRTRKPCGWAGSPISRRRFCQRRTGSRRRHIPVLAAEASVTIQNQYSEFRIGRELRDPNGLAAQYALGVPCWVRPASEPYDFRRWPNCCGEFVEIRVGAHDDEALGLSK